MLGTKIWEALLRSGDIAMRCKGYLAASVGLLLAVSAAHAARFDEEGFQKLSPDERVSFAVSCLQTREKLLENFSYKLVLKSSNFGVAGNKESDSLKEQYSLVRSGDKFLFHCQQFTKNGKVQIEFVDSWDGREHRGLSLLGHRGGPSGSISSSEIRNVQELEYNLLLGYRIQTAPMTLSQWVQFPVDKPRNSVEVYIDRESGIPLVVVHITERKYLQERLWLDPAREYLPVRYEFHDGVDKNPDHNWERLILDEAKQFGQVWVPMKVTLETGTLSIPGMTQRKYEVQEFGLDKPVPDQLLVTFPTGITINDSVRNQIYEVQKDGTKKFLPFYDSDTGKTIEAEAQAEAEAAATQPATQPATKPAATAK